MSTQTAKKANLNNPNNDAYWLARGYSRRPADWERLVANFPDEAPEMTVNEEDRANLNNPNNDAYWLARGYDSRPDNWRELIPVSKTSRRRRRGRKRYTLQGTEILGSIGPLEWDSFGLLPSDGFGRLSAEDY